MDKLDWRQISARLKHLRVSNKLTIERLAELIGVSTSFIGLIERGQSGISIENLFALSQIFNCSVDFLLTGNTADSNHHTKFAKFNATLYDYSDNEIDFVVELAEFIKNKSPVKH